MPKISELTADTAPTADDLLVTVNNPAGTPTSRKATIGDVLGANLTAIAGLSTSANQITKWTGTGTASQVGTATDWLTQYPLLAGRTGGQTIIGGLSGVDPLILQGNASSATAGGINLRSPVRLRDVSGGAETLTADPGPLLRIRHTRTLNFANATFGGGGALGGPALINYESTVVWNQSSDLIGSQFLKNEATFKNATSVTANIGAVGSLGSVWTVTADTAPINFGIVADIFSGPKLRTTGGGTLTTGADLVNFESYLDVGSGVTVPMYRGFVAKAPVNAGTITVYKHFFADAVGPTDASACKALEIGALTTAGSNIAIDIDKPSGGTTNIGIRNAGTRVDVPTTKTVTAVTDTIPHDASLIYLNNTSGSSKTLTSTPTITDGVDGEHLEIINVGSQDVVLQDQGTLAGSSLRLATTTHTLGPRDSVRLVYSTTIGDWVSVGFTNVL